MSVPHPRPRGLGLHNWREHPHNRWSFQNVRELLPTARIAAPDTGAIDTTPPPPLDLPPAMRFPLGDGTLEGLLEATHGDAFLVLHQGRVAGGWRDPRFDPEKPHLLFSVSKSLTAIVAGLLEQAGLLDPEAPVSEYLDPPAGSAYAGCRVRHVLDMSVALDFEENYTSSGTEYLRYRRCAGWNPVDQTAEREGLEEFVLSLGKLGDAEHGDTFRYRSPNTDLLGLILERAGGRPFAELMSAYLWRPLGAQGDACITLDHQGAPRSAGGICATLSDLARVGQAIADGGRTRAGDQVLPAAWIEDLRHGGDREAWKRGELAYLFPRGNYRNQWYQLGDPDGAICAIGIHGQYLYVNPRRNVVICRFACQPLPLDAAVDAAILEAMNAIAGEFR